MSDVKNYSVSYSIVTNIGNSVKQLTDLKTAVEGVVTPLENAARQAKTLSESLATLAALKDFVFKPTINTGNFKASINQMINDVEKAAVIMQTSIAKALSGTFNRSERLKKLKDESSKALSSYTGDKNSKDHKNLVAQDKRLSKELKSALKEDKAFTDKYGKGFSKVWSNNIQNLKGKIPANLAGQLASAISVTANITSVVNKLTAPVEIPANVVITASQITEAINAIPTPTMKVTLIPEMSKGNNKSTGGSAGGTTSNQKTGNGRNSIPSSVSPQRVGAYTRVMNSMLPFNLTDAQRKLLFDNRQYLGRALRGLGITPTPDMGVNTKLSILTSMRDMMVSDNVLVPSALQKEIASLQKQKANIVAQNLAEQQKAANAPFAKRAQESKIRFMNSLSPMGLSQKQKDLLYQNRGYVNRAARNLGMKADLGANMSTSQQIALLNETARVMNNAGVMIPPQLQTQVNKLTKQLDKEMKAAERAAGRASGKNGFASNRTFFENMRKWGYPLTGDTSLGARTPMAVSMAKGMGVMFAISGAMSAIGSSFSQAMDYQNIMEGTRAILQNGTDSYSHSAFNKMEGIIRNVGVKTKFSAPEVASAARFLAMAGFNISQINNSIRPIADLALMGGTDLGETADKMTNIMTTFGIEAKDMRAAGNIMATTATRSNTDLLMLSESAKYGGGVANMYGKNDPNLFADTMAIFGVMGNAGIQGSSAGTALRMMYQNIFNPNKKQTQILKLLENKYGIKTTNADKSYRSMAEILVEMANKIDPKEMPEIISKLFRITAQPGANAALMAAANQNAATLVGMSEAEGTNAAEAAQGMEAVANFIDKEGLGKLVDLMIANRRAPNSNILGDIAEKMQNTLEGLWAQVTSTFTEGIVKAFESKQNEFSQMLISIRDYLAKPQTVNMLKEILNLVVGIAKILGYVVRFWAWIYSRAPKLIEFWITTQMILSQLGTLVTPFVSLVGAFTSIKHLIIGIVQAASAYMGFGAVGAAGAGAAGAAGAAGTRAVVTGFGAAGAEALVGAAAGTAGASVNAAKNKLSAKGILKKSWGNIKSGATTNYLSKVNWASVGSGFMGIIGALLSGLGSIIGLIVNPITLAIGALASLGGGIYYLYNVLKGTTEDQLIAAENARKAAEEASNAKREFADFYNELLSEKGLKPGNVVNSTDYGAIKEYNDKKDRAYQFFADVFNNLPEDASEQSINETIESWRKVIAGNDIYRLALGDKYNLYAGNLLNDYDIFESDGDIEKRFKSNWWGGNLWYNSAMLIQRRMAQGALMQEGAVSAKTQEAIRQILALKEKVQSGELSNFDYFAQANSILNKTVNLNDPNLLSANNITPEELQKNANIHYIYRLYQEGAYNAINAVINGAYGTPTAYLDSYNTLKNYNPLLKWEETWWQNVANVIEGQKLFYNVLDDNGTFQKQVTLYLKSLPNGRVDYTAMLTQIQNHVDNAKLNLQQFGDMVAAVYKMLLDNGLVTGSTLEDYIKWNYSQLEHVDIKEDWARQYYKENNLAEKPDWRGVSEDDYVKLIRTPNGQVTTLDGLTRYASHERTLIRYNTAKKSARAIFSPLNVNTPTKDASTTTTDKGTTNNTTNQLAYSSPYSNSAAKPTQVVFNIGNLANFDHMTVASSAEEKDLMAAMEPRITNVLWQMFSQASSSANNIINQA